MIAGRLATIHAEPAIAAGLLPRTPPVVIVAAAAPTVPETILRPRTAAGRAAASRDTLLRLHGLRRRLALARDRRELAIGGRAWHQRLIVTVTVVASPASSAGIWIVP